MPKTGRTATGKAGSVPDDLAEQVAARLEGRAPPHLVGIAGGVAVGKSTLAADLAAGLAAEGRRSEVLGTDAFLFPNAVLAERGLTFRKGFPETFDVDALVACLERVKAGTAEVRVPVYSHAVYDVVPGERRVVDQVDVLVVEGVNVLDPLVARLLDVSVFVDAPEPVLRQWFLDRFLDLREEARDDPSAFYHAFSQMTEDEVLRIAAMAWDTINLVNLRTHILPARGRADLVVEKNASHEVVRVAARSAGRRRR